VVNGFAQEVPKAARQSLERAMKLSTEGKPDAAIEKMKEAIKAFSRILRSTLQLGNQFMKSEDSMKPSLSWIGPERSIRR